VKEQEVILKGQPIDYELCELLGGKPTDFVVLCFNGVQLDFFGTPYLTPAASERFANMSAALNDRSVDSLWPRMWENWQEEIRKQFGLPETCTADEFRPVVSEQVSRVVAGYSEHLHAAIGLFEKVADKIDRWEVHKSWYSEVVIVAKSGEEFRRTGPALPLVIAEAVRDLLKKEGEKL
jgi:hypothetical protein